WLDADAIATCTTEGLIETFNCAFARIWLVEDDRQALRLVASSGLYTRLDGSFARVPMGAFKVGKIAQHRIPILSNALPDEDWVKDRDWAIENKIQGFAGLPLIEKNEAIGVLAIFSHRAMAPEFLEVLQILSLSVAGALASSLNHQEIVQAVHPPATFPSISSYISLSERLAALLGPQKLSLLGVEQPLEPATTQQLIEVAKQLANSACHYCRLVYEGENVVLEAILSADTIEQTDQSLHFVNRELRNLSVEIERLGGTVQTKLDTNKTVAEVRWQMQQHHFKEMSGREIPLSETPTVSAFVQGTESPLSEREQEVIVLLAQGLRDREISEQLYISERTVKFHTKNMLKKLDASTRTQAVFKATKQGWL
ncbi:MAG: LuxR C-terminal-related transcriptional regulator, partial [Phormidesmis sp.]